MARLGQEVERLYGLPLDEFTRERNEAASRLRKEGDADGAAKLKQLEKPTVAAWAVNQLARSRPDDVQELIAAGERLRKAQEAAFRGGEDLAEVIVDRRVVVDDQNPVTR